MGESLAIAPTLHDDFNFICKNPKASDPRLLEQVGDLVVLYYLEYIDPGY